MIGVMCQVDARNQKEHAVAVGGEGDDDNGEEIFEKRLEFKVNKKRAIAVIEIERDEGGVEKKPCMLEVGKCTCKKSQPESKGWEKFATKWYVEIKFFFCDGKEKEEKKRIDKAGCCNGPWS